jgi:polyisoprenoid-binding protein YceI
MKKIFLLLALTSPAHADWALNSERSALSFVSTKAINVAEVHSISDLSGGIAADGKADIMIGLASVDTGIEIRNDRMRDMLFETERFGLASVSATVDAAKLDRLGPGESAQMIIEAILSMHGVSRPLQMELMVVRSGDSRLVVSSTKPVVINAPDFELGKGVEALREVAGLPSISLAVPVSFVLTFDATN